MEGTEDFPQQFLKRVYLITIDSASFELKQNLHKLLLSPSIRSTITSHLLVSFIHILHVMQCIPYLSLRY